MTFPQYRNFKGGLNSGSGQDKSNPSPEYTGIAEEIARKDEQFFDFAAQFSKKNYDPSQDKQNIEKLQKSVEQNKILSLQDKPTKKR